MDGGQITGMTGWDTSPAPGKGAGPLGGLPSLIGALTQPPQDCHKFTLGPSQGLKVGPPEVITQTATGPKIGLTLFAPAYLSVSKDQGGGHIYSLFI